MSTPQSSKKSDTNEASKKEVLPSASPLTKEEQQEYDKYLELEKELDLELKKLKNDLNNSENSPTEIMELLHDYNDIKDAAQVVLGALARMKEVTIASLHKQYDLPMEDE